MKNNTQQDICFVASVAVEKTVYHFDKLFDYKVPKSLETLVSKGKRVYVPFGKGNGLRQAQGFQRIFGRENCPDDREPAVRGTVQAGVHCSN